MDIFSPVKGCLKTVLIEQKNKEFAVTWQNKKKMLSKKSGASRSATYYINLSIMFLSETQCHSTTKRASKHNYFGFVDFRQFVQIVPSRLRNFENAKIVLGSTCAWRFKNMHFKTTVRDEHCWQVAFCLVRTNSTYIYIALSLPAQMLYNVQLFLHNQYSFQGCLRLENAVYQNLYIIAHRNPCWEERRAWKILLTQNFQK